MSVIFAFVVEVEEQEAWIISDPHDVKLRRRPHELATTFVSRETRRNV
ncbi:MAG: hypothetical protein H0T89_06140 [Deltaproteobacteria bacterium]|nr:hypothetical protein [Deltaproteobacteria bacterium]MDQ3295607.1 hypothetical protein [Myxococcota bacterium]